MWNCKGEKEGSHGKTKSILESIMEEKCLNEAVIGLNLDEGIHEELGLVKIDSGYDIHVRHNLDQLVPKEFIAQGSIDGNNGNFTQLDFEQNPFTLSSNGTNGNIKEFFFAENGNGIEEYGFDMDVVKETTSKVQRLRTNPLIVFHG